MPRIKKSERDRFLACISENLRICCRIFGAEKLSVVMCVSVRTVYSRIKNPDGFNVSELFRLSAFLNTAPENLLRPLDIFGSAKGGDTA